MKSIVCYGNDKVQIFENADKYDICGYTCEEKYTGGFSESLYCFHQGKINEYAAKYQYQV